jgi:outer membrane lipoprotein-sorting protein
MRISAFARYGCALAISCLAAGAAWSAASPDNAVLEYELQIKQGAQPAQKIVHKIWKKGDRYRFEKTTTAGTEITIGGPKGAYVIEPRSKEASQILQPEYTTHGLWEGLFGNTAAMRQAKKLGVETLFGRTTQIFEQRLNGPATGVAPGVKGTTRVWLAPGLPMPFKAITNIVPNMKSVMLLKSIDLNASISDSLFELPKEITVRPDPILPGMVPAHKVPKRAWIRR